MNWHARVGQGLDSATGIAFTLNTIDTQSEHRADDSARLALREEGARVMLMGEGRLSLKHKGGAFDPYFSVDEARRQGGQLEECVLLGRSSSGPVLAAPHIRDQEVLAETIEVIDFRSIYVQGLLDAETLGALAQGAALLSWHENHRFCGRCGCETVMRGGGYRRYCTDCDCEHFPRTDPVAIMLAVRQDRCLLGRSPHFAPGMYSCLAGFMEPGETIERAVRRETLEESGIKVGRVAYCASQPWPFSYSLMIGCIAEALSEEIDRDTSELEDCRWFAREEVRAILAGTHEENVTAPPPGAIARYLIESWAKGK